MDRREFLTNSTLAAGAVTLPLTSTAAKKPNIRFAFMTDVHVKPTDAAEKGMRSAFQHVNALKKPVQFIVNGGDAIMDALNASKEKVQAQWDVWHKVLNEENRLPIYHCIGNHDAWGWQMKEEAVKNDPLYDKAWVIREHQMPGRYYSFNKENWKFIVLDSAKENNGGYIARLEEEQFSWLANELKQTSNDQHIAIISHIPIVSFCSALFADENQPNGDWRISRALLHVDARRIIELFKGYKSIRCCLSGHIHLQDKVGYNGIDYYCNGAVSGNWWGGAFKGFAPAYAVFDLFKDGTVERTFMNYGE